MKSIKLTLPVILSLGLGTSPAQALEDRIQSVQGCIDHIEYMSQDDYTEFSYLRHYAVEPLTRVVDLMKQNDLENNPVGVSINLYQIMDNGTLGSPCRDALNAIYKE